jgi:CheY-like chemotaxis protein
LARKILLADDSVTAQNMGRKILADAGYEVITVNNGSAALKKIAEQKPDLIVLDVYMPGYSGLEVCQRLKDAQETSRVPVLLTVGKLEPFKPEEARRVRADGFIVKPFEASELLSALSKLEDKIVPRPESSKPGRFARANAALDEGRYDKTVAVEEDSSWKNRIAFPKKKTEPAPEENDDSTFYNPMNKDLRTVVERKVEIPQEARAEEARVDLGALAPEGLPKDVTPEEIAALAAAAAQVQGTIADVKNEEAKIEEAKIEEAKAEAVKTAELKAAEAGLAEQAAPAIPQEIAAAAFAAQRPEEKIAATSEEKIAEEKIEENAEKLAEAKQAKIEASAAKPAEAASIASPSHTDLIAAIAALEPAAAGPGSPNQGSAGQGSASSGSASSGSGNGSWLQDAAGPIDEPVTMAVAAGAAESAASRWSAVAVALAPEEAALSLEHEMQKAYAAFAAAESSHAGAVTAVPEIAAQQAQVPHTETSPSQTSQSQTSQSQSVAAPSAPEPEPAPAAAIEPVPPVSATLVQEVEQTLGAAASVTTDAIGVAVQELEAVAAAYAEQMKPAPAALVPVKDFVIASAPPVPETPQPVAASVSASVSANTEADAKESPAISAPPLAEIPQVESAKPAEPKSPAEEWNQRKEQLSQQEIETHEFAEPKAESKFEAAPIEAPKSEEPKIKAVTAEASKIEEAKIEEAKIEAVRSEAPAPVVAVAASQEEAAASVEIPEPPAAFSSEVPAERSSASPVSSPVSSSEIGSGKFSSSSIFSSEIGFSDMAAVAFNDLVAGGISDMAKKESEIAANTAAAWASWRRIRETDPKAAAPSAEPQKDEPVASAPQDAAMAVAAGAEKAFEEGRAAIDSEPDDIGSIVDSVLADLRPKIVEEISRKMGKKK